MHETADLNLANSRSETFCSAGVDPHYPPDLGAEPVHIDVALRFDVPRRHAEGRVTTAIRANRAGVRQVELDAVDLDVRGVSDPAGRPVEWRYDGAKLVVLWADDLAVGETREIAVDYSVTEPVSGLHFAVPDEAYPDRAAWVATDHETERARYWLPCIDHPAVRTTLSFALTAPAETTILANGLLVGEERHGDGSKTARWRLDFPCPSYLVCFAIGDFVRADDEPVDGREISYFAARGRATAEDLLRSFGRTPKIMRWLEGRLGVPLPFPKYFQFALPHFGGAMENISLVSWDDSLVADATVEADLGEIIDGVNVHEMAHSWFGDAVVIRDFSHAWLKESWATYMEVVWREELYGDDALRFALHQCGSAYMQEADEAYRRPIVTRRFESSWDLFDRHLYPGGAWRLHMLRRMLGDETFWAAVTDYLRTYSGRTVETDDFRRKLEQHSGRSLGRFFDEWFHGHGYPKLKASFEHDAEKGRGTLKIEQTQVSDDPKEREKPDAQTLFTFDLTVAWESAEGTFERRTFRIDRRTETLHLPMAQKPLQIRIDPDSAVLFALDFHPGDAMLERAIRHGPDAAARILAAEALAKSGKRKAMRAIAAAYREEPFWGVRFAMGAAVARSKTAAATEALAEFLRTERHPRVLRMLAEQAGPHRDARIAAALTELLDDDRASPLVAAGALRSLGAQRGEAHLPRLRKATESESWRDVVRAGALSALGETRTDAAFDDLAPRLAYGALSDDAVPAAAVALGGLASHLPRPRRDAAVEGLIDLLKDPRERTRKAAADALKAAGAPDAAGAVEAMLATLPAQLRPRFRKTVHALRAGAGERPPIAALTKRIEELEERNRKLEDRLDALEHERRGRNG